MYTHKIISKEVENGVLVLGVEFTDGADVVTEGVTPSDEAGLKHWIKARLDSLNSLKAMESLKIDDVIDLEDPVVAEQTTEETAKAEWESNYAKLQRAEDMKKLATNTAQALTAEELEAMEGLAQLVKATFKIEYLN